MPSNKLFSEKFVKSLDVKYLTTYLTYIAYIKALSQKLMLKIRNIHASGLVYNYILWQIFWHPSYSNVYSFKFGVGQIK